MVCGVQRQISPSQTSSAVYSLQTWREATSSARAGDPAEGPAIHVVFFQLSPVAHPTVTTPSSHHGASTQTIVLVETKTWPCPNRTKNPIYVSMRMQILQLSLRAVCKAAYCWLQAAAVLTGLFCLSSPRYFATLIHLILSCLYVHLVLTTSGSFF